MKILEIQSEKKRTAFSLGTGLVTVLVQFLVSFFLSPFIVSTLGPEANGYSQLASNFVMYASLLTVAFNSMASRFISVEYHRGNFDKAQYYYSSIYVVNIALILLLLPLSCVVVYDLEHIIVIDNATDIDVKTLFSFVFASFLLGLVSSLYSMSMYIKNRMYISNMLHCLTTVLNAVLLLVLFSVLPPKIFYVSFSAMLMTMLVLPVYVRVKRKILPEVCFRVKNFSFGAVKELFLSGLWNSVNQCGHLLNTGLDLLLSNWFITPYAMGMVAVSKALPTAIIQLSNTININFSPSITQTWAKGDKRLLIKELRMAIRISTVIVSIPIVTFCCIGNDFYVLWQPTLDSGTLTLLSVLGCMAFIPVAGTQTLYNVMTATNRLRVNSVSFILMGVANVVIVYLILKYLPDYNIYAIVGVSSTLSILRNLTIVLPYISKLLGVRWYEFYKDIAITLGCCMVNVLVATGVMWLVPADGWFSLGMDIVVVCAATLMIEVALLFSRDEKSVLLKQFKTIIRR